MQFLIIQMYFCVVVNKVRIWFDIFSPVVMGNAFFKLIFSFSSFELFGNLTRFRIWFKQSQMLQLEFPYEPTASLTLIRKYTESHSMDYYRHWSLKGIPFY